ncbi:MAG: hypothetical protein QM624_18685 [Micropruina sp.]
MQSCEACGRPLSDDALRCPACGRPVPDAVRDDAGQSQDAERTGEIPPVRFTGDPAGPSESSPESDDWDPDETTRFRPVEDTSRNRRNTLALVSLSVALIAAVVSLAWLIGQTVGARPITSGSAPATVTATPLSSTPPRSAVVCTTEVARSTNTSCAVATRVLSAVRTLGTDLPDKFRVTIVDPNSQKNATYVCSIKAWIECSGPGDARVYVRRLI